jgi:hypothetical protein
MAGALNTGDQGDQGDKGDAPAKRKDEFKWNLLAFYHHPKLGDTGH